MSRALGSYAARGAACVRRGDNGIGTPCSRTGLVWAWRWCAGASLVAWAVLIGGCASRLPVYRPMSAEAAWEVVSARAIERARAEADATLTGEDGSSVRVDAAIVMREPDEVRLRAWKVGQAVLDVTGNGEGVWVDTPEVPGRDVGELGVEPRELVRGLLLLAGWEATGQTPVRAARSKGVLTFEFESGDGVLACEVDARTLVVTRWRRAGGYTMELAEYRLVDGVAWAHDVVMRARGRSVRLRLRNVELNREIDDRAFVPARGARRLP